MHLTNIQRKRLKPLILLAALCALLYSGWWFLKWKMFAVPIVHSVAFSPNGRYIAGAGGWLVPHDGDPVQGALWLWEKQNGRLHFRLIAGKEVLRMAAFSQDGSTVAGWQSDGKKFLWDVATGRILETSMTPLPEPDLGIGEYRTFSLGSNLPCVLTASGCRIQSAEIVVSERKRRKAVEVAENASHANKELLALQDKGDFIATSKWNEKKETSLIFIKNSLTGTVVSKFPSPLANVRFARFSPDGKSLAIQQGHSSRRNLLLLLWHFESQKVIPMKRKEDLLPLSIAFSPDGKVVAEGDLYGRIQLSDTRTGNVIAQWQAD